THAHRPKANLHVRQDFPFQPVHSDHGDRQSDEHQQHVDRGPEKVSGGAWSLVAAEVRLDVFDEGVHQRSTSPRTISSVPMTAITSATSWSRHITSSACRFTKLGGRTRTR